MKKILLSILLFTEILIGQNAGSTGLSFLKSSFGARNLAMGDLGVAGPEDMSSFYYNPAMLSNFISSQLFIAHNQAMQDLSSQIFGASFEVFDMPFAVSMNTTSVDGIEVRTQPGEIESKFKAHYFFTGLSTGFSLYENFSAGLTIKYVYENLFSDESSGLSYDLGLYYSDLYENLNVGVSFRNLGSMNKLRNEASRLPKDFRLGVSYESLLEMINSEILLTGGYQKYTDLADSHIHLGGEIFYDNLLALRAGYITGYDSKGLTFGTGISWNNINFDYAFVPYEYDLGNSHTISLMYTFN